MLKSENKQTVSSSLLRLGKEIIADSESIRAATALYHLLRGAHRHELILDASTNLVERSKADSFENLPLGYKLRTGIFGYPATGKNVRAKSPVKKQ